MRGIPLLAVAALCWSTGTGCEGVATEAHDAAVDVTDLAVVVLPDLAPRAPGFCSAVSCRPPGCCGVACKVAGDCCPGTTCLGGVCKPPSCAACGERGCIVVAETCETSCAVPPCCLAACQGDGDCCPATKCQKDTLGVGRCVPKACGACAGLRPVCDVDGMCEAVCRPPASCGMACTLDADCGTDNACRLFLDGKRRCVPSVFEHQCNECGSDGCLFHPDTCDIDCAPPPDAGVNADGGALSDGGPLDGGSSGSDGGAPADFALAPDLSSHPPGPDAGNISPNCKSCCAPCANDAECCGDQRCLDTGGGQKICAPSACGLCPFGCKFTCPR